MSKKSKKLKRIDWCEQLLIEGHCRQGEDDPRMCENYPCTFLMEMKKIREELRKKQLGK